MTAAVGKAAVGTGAAKAAPVKKAAPAKKATPAAPPAPTAPPTPDPTPTVISPAPPAAPAWADTGAGVVLSLILWTWVVLPFLKNGPSGVKAMIRAKFTNKAPDGSWLP